MTICSYSNIVHIQILLILKLLILKLLILKLLILKLLIFIHGIRDLKTGIYYLRTQSKTKLTIEDPELNVFGLEIINLICT